VPRGGGEAVGGGGGGVSEAAAASLAALRRYLAERWAGLNTILIFFITSELLFLMYCVGQCPLHQLVL
jgi:hypothetical protein